MDHSDIDFIDHHRCHANHALFASPLRNDYLVLTMDGSEIRQIVQ